MRAASRALPVLVATVTACGGGRGPAAPLRPADAPIAVAVDGGAPVTPDAAVATPGTRAPGAGGVGHFAEIAVTATARHGDAAVSVDGAGEARLWTALDGSAPPRRLGAPGLIDPRVERAGDDLVVGGVLPGGVGYLAVHHAKGTPARELPIDNLDGDVVAVVPTIDARAAIAVRADQALELYALDGTRRARVELGRARVRGIAAIGHDAVLVVLRTADERTMARRYRVRGATLVADADVALPHAPLDGRPIAVSPGGTRLATFRALDAAAAAPSRPGPAKPEPAPDRAPSPPDPAITLQVIDLASGTDVTPAALAGRVLDAPQRLAFSADDRLHLSDGSGSILDIALADGAITTATGVTSALLSAGDGVVVGGTGGSLLVQRPAHAPVYLGYRLASPRVLGLSPDGTRLVAVGFTPEIVVEALAADAPARTIPVETGAPPSFVAFLDAARILVVDEGHHAIVYDSASGAVVQRTDIPDSHAFAMHPRRTWMFGVRDRGGFWAMRLDPSAAQPLGAPLVVDDGTALIAPIDRGGDAGDAASEAVVATHTGNAMATYTANELARAATMKRKKRPSDPMRAVIGGDELGHFYVNAGTSVAVLDVAGAETSWPLPVVPEAVWPLPAGGVLVRTAAAGGATAYGLDGAPRWSVATGATVTALASSADRSVLALATPTGVVVVDAATGEPRAARCGLAFGAWTQATTGGFPAMSAVCR